MGAGALTTTMFLPLTGNAGRRSWVGDAVDTSNEFSKTLEGNDADVDAVVVDGDVESKIFDG